MQKDLGSRRRCGSRLGVESRLEYPRELSERWRSILASGELRVTEARRRRFTGEYWLVEDTVSGCYCSVFLLDLSRTKSRLEAAPSLPSWCAVLNGGAVSCDSGVFLRFVEEKHPNLLGRPPFESWTEL